MHRALQVLNAINAALPPGLVSGVMPIGYRPAETSVVLTMDGLQAEGGEGGQAPDTLQRATWELSVASDFYVYADESTALLILFDMVSQVHRTVMDDVAGGTYDGLPFVIGAWLGEMTEPEVDASLERSFCYARHTWLIQYAANPADPEN